MCHLAWLLWNSISESRKKNKQLPSKWNSRLNHKKLARKLGDVHLENLISVTIPTYSNPTSLTSLNSVTNLFTSLKPSMSPSQRNPQLSKNYCRSPSVGLLFGWSGNVMAILRQIHGWYICNCWFLLSHGKKGLKISPKAMCADMCPHCPYVHALTNA
jgi:hypothetical protein